MRFGNDANDAAAFLLSSGPVRYALDQTDDSGRTQARQAITVALRFREQPGGLWLRGSAWLVSATRPSMSHVVVVESDAMLGGRPRDPSNPPHYTVRATVPAGHMNDAMRAEMVSRITQTLARLDRDPQRLYHEPSAWVHIIETPDGNMGAFGRIVVNPDFRPGPITAANDPAVPAVIDPICGMTITLTDTAITLELGGTTHAFCSTACRDLFSKQQAASPQ